MNTPQIKDVVTPLNKKLISTPDELLSAALSKLSHSEDVLFVFEDKVFLGILTVYSALYKKRYAPTTKVRQVMFQPMIITENSSLYHIASYMSEEQIFMLPYLEEDTVTGLIEAKTIAKLIQKDEFILDAVSNFLEYKTVETVPDNASMKDIYPILRDTGTLGVVAIGENGKAKDFVSRHELMNTLIKPTDKQRFGKDGNRPTDWAFDKENVKRLDDSIHMYLSGRTLYAKSDSSVKENIRKLLSSKQDVIVIVDEEKNPIKLLSVLQILQAFASLQPTTSVNIVMKKPGNNVSDQEFDRSYKSLVQFSEKMHKRTPLEKILVSTEVPKYQNKRAAIYNSTIILVPSGEGQYVANAQGKSYFHSLNTAMKQIEKQQRRDHVQENTFSAEDSLDNQSL